MAGQLVLVPIFLAAWGEVRYGEWLTPVRYGSANRAR